MASDWLWKLSSYNAQTCGAYTVTKHENRDGGWFYIAWFRSENLGDFKESAAARYACALHAVESEGA